MSKKESPDFTGYDDLSVFVIDGDDVKSQPSLWDALGLRGNQSGPIQVEDVEVPAEQIVGPVGDGAASNDEAVDPWFLIGSSSVWNGIALGGIDIAKRQTTRKKHVDVGLRVAEKELHILKAVEKDAIRNGIVIGRSRAAGNQIGLGELF